MPDHETLGLPEAARRLGVPVRVLRHAIRTGRLPPVPNLQATSALPAGWLERAEAVVAEQPKVLDRTFRQKVPPFARYVGTSAWRQYAVKVRAHERFRAAGDAVDAATPQAG